MVTVVFGAIAEIQKTYFQTAVFMRFKSAITILWYNILLITRLPTGTLWALLVKVVLECSKECALIIGQG